jgi:glycosyltransferase involved in cell wall biosynthesis
VIAAAFVIPGDIGQPTGGYAYDRHVLARLPQHGVPIRHVELPGSFPAPTEADLAASLDRLAKLPPATVLLFDGLAYGAMTAETIGRIRQPVVALVHHPLALEAGLAPMRARYLQQCEQMALALAEQVVVTSPMTGRILTADFAVAPSKIAVAEPGTDPADRASGNGTPLQLLAVGSIVPRKGYGVLAEALRLLPPVAPWHLTIVGAVRDEAARAGLASALAQAGADGRPLSDHVTVTGALDDAALARLYASTDVFVMPSLYEGYGMVLAEAMARGLPIVCTSGVAAAHSAPPEALKLVRPGDAAGFASALGAVLGDAELRQRMSDASWAGGRRLPTWDDTARRIAEVLKKVRA